MSSLKKVKNNLIKNIHFFLIIIFALFPLLTSSTSLKSKFVIVFTFSFIIFLGILNSKTSLQRIEELVLFFIFTIFVFFNFYDFWRTRNFLLYILAYVLALNIGPYVSALYIALYKWGPYIGPIH